MIHKDASGEPHMTPSSSTQAQALDRKREKVELLEVPKSMMELAERRGSNHLVKFRSIEANMGAAYLQGFHDALIASGFLHRTGDTK